MATTSATLIPMVSIWACHSRILASAYLEKEHIGCREISFRESIQHLQDELTSGEPLSNEDRAELETVLGEVTEILDSEQSEASSEGRSFGELPTLVERFESTHPKLAVVLGRIADSLSQLGI